jgi:hypothetical protein
MIRVVAGFLREPDSTQRGRDDVSKWKSLVEDLGLLADSHQPLDNYSPPLLAFQLSVQSMGMEEKQLLAVLRHFSPVQEVSVAVVKAVWQGVWPPQGRTFEALLKKLQRMNVVDVHLREYCGFKYGEHSSSYLIMPLHTLHALPSTSRSRSSRKE